MTGSAVPATIQKGEHVPHFAPDPARRRLVSLDALRGLAIVILILVNTAGIHSALPEQLHHSEWHGLTFADVFFPVFLFTMGGAMEFSSRAGRFASVARRVVILFVLGVGLQWLRLGSPEITGILQKIAVAYLVAWLVMRLPRGWHLPVTVGFLGAVWAAFTWVPAPGVDPGSWEQGTNFGSYVDRLVIGHPATEGFFTSLMAVANVIGGALVVRGVRGLSPRRGLRTILVWGVATIALGLLLSGAVPINKRIWTPSFILVTHGITCLILAAYWLVAEIGGLRGPVRPFVVLGRNPITIFVLFTALHVFLTPVRGGIVGPLADATTATTASLVWSGTMTVLGIVLAWWLDRRRIYIKV